MCNRPADDTHQRTARMSGINACQWFAAWPIAFASGPCGSNPGGRGLFPALRRSGLVHAVSPAGVEILFVPDARISHAPTLFREDPKPFSRQSC